MQTYHAVTPHTRTTPRHITPHQQAVYGQLRQAVAMAGGLEAIASQALDAGDATPAQLDYIAELSSHLTEHLTTLTQVFAELPNHR